MRRISPTIAAVLALSPACAGPGRESTEADSSRVVVSVAVARIETLRETVVAAGQVVPATSADWTIVAPEPAIIAELPKMPDDPVTAGELLVRFEIASLTQNYNARQLAVAEATARTEQARAEVNRLTSLFEQGVIPRNMLDSARAELNTAAAAQAAAEAYLEEARVMRDAARITARFDGIVAERWHAEGDFVTGERTDPVLRVIDPTRLEIAARLPLDQAAAVREGQPASIQTPSAGVVEGTVLRRAGGLRADSDTAELRLSSDSLDELALNDIVRVELALAERRDAVVVPAEAVQRDPSSAAYLMVVDVDDVVRRRPVRVGMTTDALAQIVSGIAAGERVVVQGLDEVTDGMPVTVSR